MRTTIEIDDQQRAALLELAARRGRKGFSDLVGEAIDEFLRRQKEREERLGRALAAEGSLSAREASELDAGVVAARATWRSPPEE